MEETYTGKGGYMFPDLTVSEEPAQYRKHEAFNYPKSWRGKLCGIV